MSVYLMSLTRMLGNWKKTSSKGAMFVFRF
ncbi:hypothetical protein CsSME_00035862 [Camellia sinensis var. sinensis]